MRIYKKQLFTLNQDIISLWKIHGWTVTKEIIDKNGWHITAVFDKPESRIKQLQKAYSKVMGTSEFMKIAGKRENGNK